ncbi:MAG: phosphoribosylaminoimidazolesuccinocarboxamide synthase [Opitutales bacterium]
MQVEALQKTLPQTALLAVEGLQLERLASGKVRELFDAGDGEHLLMVATDRLSAFDVILPTGIPGKGVLLTQLSLWWFERTKAVIGNHLPEDAQERLRALLPQRTDLWPRSMLVRKLAPLPLEAVVRGYLAGSGWQAYRETGLVQGHELPAGLRESARLPEPIFTPTTKAAAGHDLPLTEAQARDLVGAETFAAVRAAALALYQLGAETAKRAGMLLADTKFEFGRDATGTLCLIDEVLTPDSSRYWPMDGYAPGQPQPAYDKQYVRDYLEGLDWDKTAPGPALPEAVVQQTQARYLEAYRRLVG